MLITIPPFPTQDFVHFSRRKGGTYPSQRTFDNRFFSSRYALRPTSAPDSRARARGSNSILKDRGCGAVASVGELVTEYLGELYPAWRWFEKQIAIKKAQKRLHVRPELPDFYNIMLERHRDDEDGYDLLFVDPVLRGNFASRLCHSCDPNCATVVVAHEGRYRICVYALRDIARGEELTFDYSSVTESEEEFKAAICLCGTSACRGAFLSILHV